MFELFMARRLYFSPSGRRQVSRPAVRMALLGIIVGLAVMIAAIAVAIGFKREVRGKLAGLGAHIQVTRLSSNRSYEMQPVAVPDSLLQSIRNLEGVAHVQRFSTKPGILQTGSDFAGIVVKGVGPEYDTCFLSRHLTAGCVPAFSDSISTGRVLVSQTLADKMHLHVGGKFSAYFIQNEVRARQFTVAGIYQTHLEEFDRLLLFADLHTVGRLNRWQPDQAGGIEIHLQDDECTLAVADELGARLANRPDAYGACYYVQTLRDLNPQMFAWLDLLDINVWVILLLMSGVAGFTLVSGLLIFLLERTPFIGLMKAMGADNRCIRRIFLWFAALLIGRGMLLGNLLGLGLCATQYLFGWIRLDAATYYVDRVPIGFDAAALLLLNLASFTLSMWMVLGPTRLIGRISPARSIRFE
ncbi:MAG: ABC transporter permease [Bacteroidaceae bacterium]